MTKYTPGPWKWWPGSTATERELCQAQYRLGEHDSILYHGADWPMKEADVRLIAKAPEMAEASRSLLRAWDTQTALIESCDLDDGQTKAAETVRRILAEIDGE